MVVGYNDVVAEVRKTPVRKAIPAHFGAVRQPFFLAIRHISLIPTNIVIICAYGPIKLYFPHCFGVISDCGRMIGSRIEVVRS